LSDNERFRIKNWDSRQSLRSDVGGPGPWIKIYKTILSNRKIAKISDAEFGRLIKMWLLASMEKDTWGELPADPVFLRKVCMMDKNPDLQALENIGLIESVNGPLTGRTRAVDDPSPQCRAVQCRAGQDKTKQDSPPDRRTDALVVLGFLNKTTGKRFSNSKNIEACLKREKCTVEDCKAVIRFKWGEWEGTDMAKHINATTPFRASHFQNYLDESKAGPGGNISGHVNQKIGPDGNPMAQWEIDMARDFEEMDRRGNEQVSGS
jgi:uncharacterized phage protein (TIGR02220 family)